MFLEGGNVYDITEVLVNHRHLRATWIAGWDSRGSPRSCSSLSKKKVGRGAYIPGTNGLCVLSVCMLRVADMASEYEVNR